MVFTMGYEAPDFFEFEVSPDLDTPSSTSPLSTPPMQSPFPMPPHTSGIAPPLSMSSNSTNIPSPFRFFKLSDEDPVLPAILAAENLKTTLLASALLSFIFLISKDAHKALMRRAHWIPCDFLVLSAFSIQLLTLLNAQNQTLAVSSNVERLSIKKSMSSDQSRNPPNAPWKDILMIHNSRTIMCIFTAYVMPSMAERGLEHAWVRLSALVITVFHHLTSQFYDARDNIDVPKFLRVWPRENENKDAAYYAHATLISLCFILLILLLACATISVRSLERIVAKKISLVLKGEGEFCNAAIAERSQEVHRHHHLHNHSCWRNVKIDINRTDHHYHLHQVHDHSCFQTVEEVVLRMGNEDENQSHSCWRTVEDALRRTEQRELENEHSCWQTIEDAAVRGEKAEEERYRRHCHHCWRRVEDAVLKAWIIVRAYSVQPILARSALTAAATFILTVQILITIVGGVSKVLDEKNKREENPYEIIATALQCILIFIGWSLIVFRWASAVAYYRSSEEDCWRSGLEVEDYWTRHLRDLQQARNRHLQEAKSLDNEINELVSRKGITGSVPSIFLSAAIWLQWSLVSFSKVCWLVSLAVFHNKWTSKLYCFVFRKHELLVDENYSKYINILKDVEMIGETSESLWVAHRNAIEKAKRLILQGNQDGEYNCDHLIEFLIKKRTSQGLDLSCLEPHKPQRELKFLCKKRSTESTRQPQKPRDMKQQQSVGRGKEPLAVEDQFTEATTKSWKMTAVSLLGIIVHLSPIYAEIDKDCVHTPQAVKDCMDAYSQAWEIIDFVEEADTEPDEITSDAADMYFRELQSKVEKGDFSAKPATTEGVRAALQQLKQESESNTEPLESANFISKFMYAVLINGEEEKERGRPSFMKSNDSIDWKASAAKNYVHSLCSSIEHNNDTEVSELLNKIESSLADILNECLAKAQQLLLVKSREWALNRDEERMGKALYTAGKAKTVMEKLVCNKLAIVSCR